MTDTLNSRVVTEGEDKRIGAWAEVEADLVLKEMWAYIESDWERHCWSRKIVGAIVTVAHKAISHGVVGETDAA